MPTKPASEKKEDKKRIHHPLLYVFSVIILVIIVVTFVGTPVIGGMAGPGRIVFGYYKNKPIEYVPGNYFSRQKDLLAEQIRSTGEDKSNIEYQLYQVWRGAFERTLFHTAIVATMQESGAHVTESLVDEALTRYPAYLENGEFSERRYQQTASSERFLIRNTTRESLLFNQYIQDLFGIRIAGSEVEFFKSMSSPERKFRFVNFSFTEYPDSQVAEYGKENSEKFKRSRLSVITVTTGRSDAEKVREQAAARAASFEDLAKTHSKDTFAEKGGDMGWQYFYELDGFVKSVDEIRSVFALKNGDVSPVIEGPGGFSFFRVDEQSVDPDFASAEVLKTVRDYMTAFERGRIEDFILSNAKNFQDTAGRTSFAAAASSLRKTAQETGFFPINYGNSVFLKPVTQNNDALGSAAFRDTFFSVAFSLAENEVSEPVVLRDNIVVLQLAAEQQAEENSLQFMDAYFPFIVQQFQEEGLQQFVMNTSYLKDDFNSVFMKYFLPQ